MTSGTTTPEQMFGYEVTDGSGTKIGTVDNVWVDDATGDLEFIGVKTGFLFGKTHVIPTADAQIGQNQIQVPYGQDQVKDAPSYGTEDELSPEDEDQIYAYYGLNRSTSTSPTGEAMGTRTGGFDTTMTTSDYGTTGTTTDLGTGSDEQTVALSEEELAVGKRDVQAGQVRLRKVVHTEHQEVPVELRREDVEIERVPASEIGQVPGSAFQEGEVNVPLMQEEPVVEKQARVTGGVRINKDVETETQTVGGDIRREDVDVDRDVTTSGVTSGMTQRRYAGENSVADDANEGPIDRLGDKVEDAVGHDF